MRKVYAYTIETENILLFERVVYRSARLGSSSVKKLRRGHSSEGQDPTLPCPLARMRKVVEETEGGPYASRRSSQRAPAANAEGGELTTRGRCSTPDRPCTIRTR